MKTNNAASILVGRLWVVALLFGVAAPTGAARAQESLMFQPQGLERAGVYALRQLDPSLDGTSLRFGVVSRSFTYSEADENAYVGSPPSRISCVLGSNVIRLPVCRA